MPTERRLQRLNRTIMKELGDIILKKVKDPRLNSMVSVISAEITPDLHHVHVILSIYGEKEINNLKSLQAIQHASGYIASLLGDALRLKHTPELHFQKSDSLEKGSDIYFQLKELSKKSDEK